MAFSRSARIITLLVIDTIFFLLEITIGYAVHSLALVADSFHMLNDIFSLIVALWAIKLAKQRTNCNSYTYGWQRAEILGALINGVFLIALCVSIFLEAIQRLLDPPEITDPKLILIVGSAGLASNIVGLFLFHDHGHGHGEEEHDHGKDLEEQATDLSDRRNPATDTGSINDVLPQTIVERASKPFSPRPRSGSLSSRFGTSVQAILEEDGQENENTPLLKRTGSPSGPVPTTPRVVMNGERERTFSQSIHMQHHHTAPKSSSSSSDHGHSHGGHSHGNLNMRGVFLHVLGDALGNIGVIATALFIIYSSSPHKFYADPIISLIITIIIFSSALPLCRSASKILLQAVPGNIHLSEVREDLSTIPGVGDVHELHIWQLSDTKLVASVHVRVSFDIAEDKVSTLTQRYIGIDRAIRTCLHAYGIHSSTIQQEFVARNSENTPRMVPAATGDGDVNGEVRVFRRETGEVVLPGGACLLDCGEDCSGGKCCPIVPGTRSPGGSASRERSVESSHRH